MGRGAGCRSRAWCRVQIQGHGAGIARSNGHAEIQIQGRDSGVQIYGCYEGVQIPVVGVGPRS